MEGTGSSSRGSGGVPSGWASLGEDPGRTLCRVMASAVRVCGEARGVKRRVGAREQAVLAWAALGACPG